MKRILLGLLIALALAGCEYLPLFTVADILPPVASYTRGMPAVEPLDDGTSAEWHDFAGRC